MLNDKSGIHAKLSEWASMCLKLKIPASRLLKIPGLFIESMEDEMEKEIHYRAIMAWEKILRALTYQLIGLLKEKTKSESSR